MGTDHYFGDRVRREIVTLRTGGRESCCLSNAPEIPQEDKPAAKGTGEYHDETALASSP